MIFNDQCKVQGLLIKVGGIKKNQILKKKMSMLYKNKSNECDYDAQIK